MAGKKDDSVLEEHPPQPNFDKAMALFGKEDIFDPAQRAEALKAASYLRLAVEKNEGSPGSAAEQLGRVMLGLNEPKKAEEFSKLAISQEPNSVVAYFVMFVLAAGRFENARGVGSLGRSGDLLFDILGGLVTGGVALADKSAKKSGLHEATLAVGKAFVGAIEERKFNPEYLIVCAELVLSAADLLADNYKIKEPSLYQIVVDAPWDELNLTKELRGKAADLVAQAEGALLL